MSEMDTNTGTIFTKYVFVFQNIFRRIPGGNIFFFYETVVYAVHFQAGLLLLCIVILSIPFISNP